MVAPCSPSSENFKAGLSVITLFQVRFTEESYACWAGSLKEAQGGRRARSHWELPSILRQVPLACGRNFMLQAQSSKLAFK